MSGAGEIDDVGVALDDHAIEMRVDETQSRRRPPMSEQPRLDVLGAERLAEQRIVLQKDLTDGEVVGCRPVAVDRVELRRGQRAHVPWCLLDLGGARFTERHFAREGWIEDERRVGHQGAPRENWSVAATA